MWILDLNLIGCQPAPVSDFELAPETWYARIYAQAITLQLESQDAFQRRPIHPSGRTCIPRPTPASGVRRHGIDISRCDIRLNFVLMQTRTGRSMINGIE